VFVDFDGTLAAIVDDAAAARPLPGAVEALGALAARYAKVAVVSGRPVAFLARHLLAPGVILSGLYGLESWNNGAPVDHPAAEPWRQAVEDVATRAEAELPEGVAVERKGLSVTLHVRRHPEAEPVVLAWAQQAAQATGLALHQAKWSWELRPPVAADKGTVVTDLSKGLDAVCFVGDDRGDLPAFEALDRLRGRGQTTRKVAVRSDEVPAELLAAADEAVDGPGGALDLLRRLAAL
jgi:trehalose 6-phosphate phosphatase